MKKEALGILVSSTAYGEFALYLAEAAIRAGKSVRIHAVGCGTDLVRKGLFAQIAGKARVHVCRLGMDDGTGTEGKGFPKEVAMESAGELIGDLGRCCRQVVF